MERWRAVCTKDKAGCTPVHAAAASGAYEVVRVLCEHNDTASVMKDAGGRLPIHYAATKGHLEVRLRVVTPTITTTHHSPLTTHHSSLITHRSPPRVLLTHTAPAHHRSTRIITSACCALARFLVWPSRGSLLVRIVPVSSSLLLRVHTPCLHCACVIFRAAVYSHPLSLVAQHRWWKRCWRHPTLI
jgi:hypothetical protein